ncbi:response regulator transcription factor [PVC group bacterium]|nr:response regulator transcription factor [PVC group bacterium]
MVEQKKKILIVDDEPEFAKLIKTRLTSEGYLVDTAKDGQQGLDKVKACPDLVILDVMMPNLGGIEFAKIIKESPQTAKIPIIFLTAKEDEQTRIDGIRSGADYFLTKPFDSAELLEIIKKLVHRNA